jgi:cytochrome c
MRASLVFSCLLALVACGPSDAAGDGTDLSGLPAAYQDANPTAGARVWFLCAACHQIVDGTAHAVGPDLYGIFGKTAGTNDTFPLYSPALKESGIVWTPEEIDTWITNPRDVLPTTTMIFPGVAKEEDRKNLIAYLWQETGGANVERK